MEGLRHNFWLIDSASDVHVCNDRSLMTEYYNKSTKIGWSTSDGSSPGKGKIRLQLDFEAGSEDLLLNLQNVYYLPSSSCNFVSLGLLNNSTILHDNENKTLYQLGSKRVLAQVRRWRNSYLLKLLNLPDAAVFLVKIDDKMYNWPPHAFLTSSPYQTSFPIAICHKRLGHTNFASVRRYLKPLGVDSVDDAEGHICDSCQRAKATKVYNHDPKKRS